MRIVQILLTPDDNPAWKGVLLGLGEDGFVYGCRPSGHWESMIPPPGELASNQPAETAEDDWADFLNTPVEDLS